MNATLATLRAHARELLEHLPGYPGEAIKHLDAGDTPDAMHDLLVLRRVVRGQGDAAALDGVDAALGALMRVRVAEEWAGNEGSGALPPALIRPRNPVVILVEQLVGDVLLHGGQWCHVVSIGKDASGRVTVTTEPGAPPPPK